MTKFNLRRSVGYKHGVRRSTAVDVDQGLRDYMIGVYNYMTIGLAITGAVALGVHMIAVTRAGDKMVLTPFDQAIYSETMLIVLGMLPLLGIPIFGVGGSNLKFMSAASARCNFFAYAAVMGLSMSTILLYFTGVSVARVFFITAAAFGGLSLFGYMTKRDLSASGSFLVMGVWGLVIAGLVNLFLQSTGLQFALSILTVLFFSGLTAWDTQMIKDRYFETDGYEVAQKKSIFGAIILYLDFLLLFVRLTELLGECND
jgi:FtsH-binding integral membrane protein